MQAPAATRAAAAVRRKRYTFNQYNLPDVLTTNISAVAVAPLASASAKVATVIKSLSFMDGIEVSLSTKAQ